MNQMQKASNDLVARGYGAIREHEAAKESGLPSRIAAARTDVDRAKRDLEAFQLEKSAFDAMKAAMKKSQFVKL